LKAGEGGAGAAPGGFSFAKGYGSPELNSLKAGSTDVTFSSEFASPHTDPVDDAAANAKAMAAVAAMEAVATSATTTTVGSIGSGAGGASRKKGKKTPKAKAKATAAAALSCAGSESGSGSGSGGTAAHGDVMGGMILFKLQPGPGQQQSAPTPVLTIRTT
jgi:hypothetical protein